VIQTMKEKTNIVLSGVGGQGVITAANILGKAAVNAGVNVFVSEVHGMAQRGGSVNCTIRIGNISGPLVANGTADALVSTEPIEALRYIKFCNNETEIITDITPVVPFTVSIGSEKYPDIEKVFKEIEDKANLYKIDAVKLAKNAGALITKNVVMLGALAASDVLPFDPEILKNTILDNVPEKFKEINKKAYENGFNAYKKN
jgi:indolepyruvate ferredoxin oxidoreductase, beta subunit